MKDKTGIGHTNPYTSDVADFRIPEMPGSVFQDGSHAPYADWAGVFELPLELPDEVHASPENAEDYWRAMVSAIANAKRYTPYCS